MIQGVPEKSFLLDSFVIGPKSALIKNGFWEKYRQNMTYLSLPFLKVKYFFILVQLSMNFKDTFFWDTLYNFVCSSRLH